LRQGAQAHGRELMGIEPANTAFWKAMEEEGRKEIDRQILLNLRFRALDNYCRTGNIWGKRDNPHWVGLQWHIHNLSGYSIFIGADHVARPVYRGETLDEALEVFMESVKDVHTEEKD